MHRSLFESYGAFDESLPVCEDYDLWLRITPHEEVGLIEEKLIIKYGGHPDQLSRSEPAIDRFRVFALIKLLTSGKLSAQQTELLVDELKEKLTILKKGAVKHSPEMVSMYDGLLKQAGAPERFETTPERLQELVGQI